MSTTTLVSCTCKNEFQDKVYGKGRRVCNPTAHNPPTVRCATCGAIHKRGD